MSTTSRTRRQRATPSVGVTSPRGSTDARRRSPQASQALDLFDRVRRFFAHDSQLAQALGWDESTTAKWRDHSVTRPHAAKVAQVLLLQELCEEARAYMLDDFDVGTWLNAPLPNLHGSSPASWLRERRGVGLAELTRGLVDWTPRVPETDLEAIRGAQGSARLVADDAGTQEFRRMLDGLD
jgi:hypothetical protein